MLIVHKYGGSSLASTSKIKAIAKNLKKIKKKGNSLVVVASAMGKTTNELINLAYKITASPNIRELDALTSTGELQSTSLLAIALSSIGVKAISLSGAQAGIVTTDHFSRAFIKKIDETKIKSLLKQGYVVVVAGFQGATKNGDVATLGRGGSDTTAVALAAILKCPCEIYTDVEGVFTIDPRIYKNAKKLSTISYNEMLEMAINGAKVLETRSVELAKVYNVKLYLGKTLEKEKKGTYIMKREKIFEEMKISGLGVKQNINVLTIETPINFEYQNELLNMLSNSCQNFEMFHKMQSQSKNILSINVSENCEYVEKLLNENKLFSKAKITCQKGLTKISLVGTGLSTHKYFVKKTFEVLKENNISTYHILLSEISITFTIDGKNKQKAVEVLAKQFEL